MTSHSGRRRKAWGREEAIAAIQEFYRVHGRSPLANELRSENGLPGIPATRRLFGTFGEALEAAGYQPTQPRRSGSGITEEQVIEAIQKFYERNGRIPTAHEASRGGYGVPHHRTLKRYFGSFNEAIVAAGFQPRPRGGRSKPFEPAAYVGPGMRKDWTKESAIAAIQEWVEAHGSPPRANDRPAGPPRVPAGSTLSRLFGSRSEAVRAAGFEPRKTGSQPGRLRRRPKPIPTSYEGWAFDDRKGESAELREVAPKRRKNE